MAPLTRDDARVSRFLQKPWRTQRCIVTLVLEIPQSLSTSKIEFFHGSVKDSLFQAYFRTVMPQLIQFCHCGTKVSLSVAEFKSVEDLRVLNYYYTGVGESRYTVTVYTTNQ